MYFVHLYSLHVYCALVDLNSSGSSGVRPTPGLTSNTQVICMCVRAFTSTHPPTTLIPAKIQEMYKTKPLSPFLSRYQYVVWLSQSIYIIPDTERKGYCRLGMIIWYRRDCISNQRDNVLSPSKPL